MGLFLTKYWPSKMVKNKNAGKPRNYALEGGVHRFGRSKMYHKKAVYKFLKKKTAKKAAPKKPAFVEKKIGVPRMAELVWFLPRRPLTITQQLMLLLKEHQRTSFRSTRDLLDL